MNKDNIFRSSDFFMDNGDVLHILVKDLIGDGIRFGLNNADNDGAEDVEDIPIPVPPVPEADLVDKDGNIYTTVTIGAQEWIIENLKTTKYADGTAIANYPDYSDWFLPSYDELDAMYNNLHLLGVGNFSTNPYWCSSEVNASNAWVLGFSDGSWSWGNGGNKDDANYVRACRSFVAGAGAYSLRDIGPAGGLIFYVDGGTTYYEAAPYDQSTGHEWSNILTVLVTTATAIGTGQANTTAIVGQASHTDSAANLCDDLTNGEVWDTDTYGAYCWYNNDIANKTAYGALYNWYAVDNIRGLAYLERGGIPEDGWRVPSRADLITLQSFVGGELIAGGVLKEAGLTHWTTPNTGATNSSGFTAVGAGYRETTFKFINERSMLCSITEHPSGIEAYYLIVYYNNSTGVIVWGGKEMGYSVRLVRDI